MITLIFREGHLVGSLRSSYDTDNWGKTPLNLWVCPSCGRTYARELAVSEPGEPTVDPHYHVVERPCGSSLFDLGLDHPTFWRCADQQLLHTAFKEHFNHERHDCTQAAGDDPAAAYGITPDWIYEHFHDQFPTPSGEERGAAGG